MPMDAAFSKASFDERVRVLELILQDSGDVFGRVDVKVAGKDS